MQLAVYISSIIQQTVAIGSYGGGGTLGFTVWPKFACGITVFIICNVSSLVFERLALIHVRIVCANTGQIDLIKLIKNSEGFQGGAPP